MWDWSGTITRDGREVGGLVHVDVLSVAHIQQGGVLHTEVQQLLLNGESQRLHCKE